MLKRILVALTGTPCAATAVRLAVELAQVHQAALTGVTLVDVRRLANVGPVPIGAGQSAKELREHRIKVARSQAETAVGEFESVCGSAGVSYSVERAEGKPWDQTILLSRYHDLMVFGLRGILAHGYTRESQRLLGSLVSNGIRPMLAVSEELRPVRRALVAYSGSMPSAKTMRRFIQMRLWPDAELRIVTFEHPPEKARQLLTDAAAYCRSHGFQPETDCFSGTAREQLLPYAAQCQADVVVMGYSGRSRFSRAILGETGSHVIRNSDRTLFLAQ